MDSSRTQFLNLRHLPARLTPEETAWLLNIQPTNIPWLVEARLLKPLGRPSRTSIKYFALVTVQACAADPKWLSSATEVIQEGWREKNRRKRPGSTEDEGQES